MRILGSLLAILLLFVLTAALVKVDLSPGLFFSVTMASVWFINCKYTALPHFFLVLEQANGSLNEDDAIITQTPQKKLIPERGKSLGSDP